MTTSNIIEQESQYIVGTYVRPPVVFSHGQGMTLYDSDGNAYLDMAAGIAVNALGHSDPEWVKAVCDQAGKLAHVSNLYHTAPHVELAKRLVENSFADKVFFCNSGSEANETALKFARKVGKSAGGDTKTGVVAFTGSFHGRTIGALSVTARAKYQDPFVPLMPGVTIAPFNDVAAAAEAIDSDTCAVIVEPVQGEGGIRPATKEFLQALRQLCDEHNAVLIFDEVQCGLGRTGHLWAHQAYDVTPDIMTLAKPLAGGLPIGAALVTKAIAAQMHPGDHGSTFAAGPLVCRAGQVVFDRINQPDFLEHVKAAGAYLMEKLSSLHTDLIVEVRGLGLLVGVEFSAPVRPLLQAAAAQHLLVINAGDTILRLCPPLIVTNDDIDKAIAILDDCLQSGVLEG